MKGPRIVKQTLFTSLLGRSGIADAASAYDLVLVARLDAQAVESLLTERWMAHPGAGDPSAWLRGVEGLPAGSHLVLPSDQVPAEWLPPTASANLSAAVLALSSDLLYHPERPLVLTRARMSRSIVLLQPQKPHV
jgi:hypothetical protein